jgi:hypothetical protein
VEQLTDLEAHMLVIGLGAVIVMSREEGHDNQAQRYRKLVDKLKDHKIFVEKKDE